MTRRQIKQILSALRVAFNNTGPANSLVSWDDIADTIGAASVAYIRQGDAMRMARMSLHIILERGHRVTTDGQRVYTSHPISAEARADWDALQPALLRVIRRQA